MSLCIISLLWIPFKDLTDFFVYDQFGSVGPMAITLCQSLGQNLGMLRNKERSAAGTISFICNIHLKYQSWQLNFV